MLDNLACIVEAENIYSGGFFTEQAQVTHMDKGKVAIDGNALYLAAKAADLLEKAHDGVETIRNQRIVLDVRPGHEIRIQVGSALAEDLIIDDVENLSDLIFFHNLVYKFSPWVLGSIY